MYVKYFPKQYFVQKWYLCPNIWQIRPNILYQKNRIVPIDFTLRSTGWAEIGGPLWSHFNGNLSHFFWWFQRFLLSHTRNSELTLSLCRVLATKTIFPKSLNYRYYYYSKIQHRFFHRNPNPIIYNNE